MKRRAAEIHVSLAPSVRVCIFIHLRVCSQSSSSLLKNPFSTGKRSVIHKFLTRSPCVQTSESNSAHNEAEIFYTKKVFDIKGFTVPRSEIENGDMHFCGHPEAQFKFMRVLGRGERR